MAGKVHLMGNVWRRRLSWFRRPRGC